MPLSIPAPLRALFQRAAARDDRTLSDFIRMGAKERAHRILGITDDDVEAAA